MKVLLSTILLGLLIFKINTFYSYTDNQLYSFEGQVTGVSLTNQSNQNSVQNFGDYKGLKFVNLAGKNLFLDNSFLDNNKSMTYSFWFKLSNFDQLQYIFHIGYLVFYQHQNQLKISNTDVSQYYVSGYNHVVITSQRHDDNHIYLKIYLNSVQRYNGVFYFNSNLFYLSLNDGKSSPNLYVADVLLTRETWNQYKIDNEYNTVINSFNLGNIIYKYRIHGLSSENLLFNGQRQNQGSYTDTGELSGLTKDRLKIQKGSSFETKNLNIENEYTGRTINFWARVYDKDDSDIYELLYLRTYQNSSYSYLKIKSDGTLCFVPTFEGSYQKYCARGYIYLLQDYWFSVTITSTYYDSYLYINGQQVVFNLNDEQPIEPISRLPEINHHQHWLVKINDNKKLSLFLEDLEIVKTNYNSNDAFNNYNEYSAYAPQCAMLFSDCGFTGASQRVCGHEQNLSLSFMRSISLPPGKQIKLFTGTEFTGEQTLFTESVECQELVYLPQEESQN